jgi:UDPglucose 6-dehydrogenase
MKVGMMGLGKLGLPVALAIEDKGHEVKGSDISPDVERIIKDRKIPYQEAGAQELLDKSKIELTDTAGLVEWADIIFCPIQTPHKPELEGTLPLGRAREDFNYLHLQAGVADIAEEAKRQQRHITLVVISTCLPGTFEREIKPLLNEYVHYLYNPFFIAMGTTIQDFLKPEFVLIGLGTDVSKRAEGPMWEFYRTIHARPLLITDIMTAELIKVAYNTFIGQKITFINAMMEICEKTGANVDNLSAGLALATDRLISAKYLRGGMGDAGGCHPRDNIAMSWLARKLDLSHDIFSDQMKTREDQTRYLAYMIEQKHQETKLPVVLLGKAYKAEINLTVGSCGLLLANLLGDLGVPFVHWDPFTDQQPLLRPTFPTIFFIATNHEVFKTYPFAKGSIVLDPWGYIPDTEGVTVVRIGRP